MDGCIRGRGKAGAGGWAVFDAASAFPPSSWGGRPPPPGFVGIFERLEEALAFDSADVSGVIEDLAVLRKAFETQMEKGRREYLPIAAGMAGDKAAEAVLEHFRDAERRNAFYEFFMEIEELYEILSPDAFLRPWMKDYQALAEMYQLVRSCYDRGVVVDRSFLRKTAGLVQANALTSGIGVPGKIHELNAKTLEQIAVAEQPDTVKVFNLLKAVHDLVAAKRRRSRTSFPSATRRRRLPANSRRGRRRRRRR
jgi:type I restriction enzyme R subunit